MKRKTIAQMEADLAAARETNNTNYENGRKWRAQAEEAEKSLKEARSHFSDLKERLHNSEIENARLRGYLSRVHEDDIVRDGLVEIEDDGGKRQVPRRPPPLEQASYSPSVSDMMTSEYDPYGRQKKRTHWTSY